MELVHGDPEAVGRPAHLVQGDEPVIPVEGGVLDPLGRDGPGELLELAHEQELLPVLGFRAGPGKAQAQHVADELEDGAAHGGIAPARRGHGQVHVPAIAVRLPRAVAVRPVDGEARDDLPERGDEAPRGEVTRGAIAVGDAPQPPAEHADLAGHGGVDDELLGLVHDLSEVRPVAEEARVRLVELPLRGPVDEDSVRGAEEVVAGRTPHRPALGQPLAAHQDFLDHDVERPRQLGVGLEALLQLGVDLEAPRLPLLLGRLLQSRGRLRRLQQAAALKLPEILARRVEPVGVIDAQSGHLSRAHEPEDQAVRGLEHGGVLHPDGRQGVDVEEPPVIDVVARDLPEGEPVGLGAEKGVEAIEARRLSVRPR